MIKQTHLIVRDVVDGQEGVKGQVDGDQRGDQHFFDDFDALVQYLSELGEDLRQERKDRRRDVNELRQDIDRRFDDLSQRINQAVDRRQG